jgi:hypothetical protein
VQIFCFVGIICGGTDDVGIVSGVVVGNNMARLLPRTQRSGIGGRGGVIRRAYDHYAFYAHTGYTIGAVHLEAARDKCRKNHAINARSRSFNS